MVRESVFYDGVRGRDCGVSRKARPQRRWGPLGPLAEQGFALRVGGDRVYELF